LNRRRVFITGMGIISPLGLGVERHLDSLKKNESGIGPISLFTPSPGNSFPVGEVPGFAQSLHVPRTHELALVAAREALSQSAAAPDSIVLGTTTGGMPVTEELLKKNETDPELYRYHSTSTVAEFLASELHCTGMVLTITTACSSGAAAIKLAYELVRTGTARRVLAGGADALCRLTYYGFNSLQLIDPAGARPLDRGRKGMSVAEGSAMLLLEAGESRPEGAIAELLGGGLSCDAFHPATPHPEGRGALAAMRQAVQNAGVALTEIRYVNLHGTGTKDNDLAEAKAMNSLFGNGMPLLSSVKGAFGHTLAASGAIEAVVCAAAVSEGIIPANTRCTEPDPELNLKPVLAPLAERAGVVMSNSFGFGGNNACLVLADPCMNHEKPEADDASEFEITGCACITGAGDTDQTMQKLQDGGACIGTLPLADISKSLPPREVRRLKRLPRIALALAMEARKNSNQDQGPSAIFFGTSFGPMSETYDFITRLYASNEQFTSPTEFVGSVHNAPAGMAAIMLGASGANLTLTGGDYSFEQALIAASLTATDDGGPLLVMGADEFHETLSPLFDESVRLGRSPSDGGGALMLRKYSGGTGVRIKPLFFENQKENPAVVASLVRRLGGAEEIRARYGALLAGMPMKDRGACETQLKGFISAAGFKAPVIDFRKYTGEYGSSTAAAAAIAVRFIHEGEIPASVTGGGKCLLGGREILIIGLGSFITAFEIFNYA